MARKSQGPFLTVTRRQRGAVLGAVTFLALLIGALNLPQGELDLALIYVAALLYFTVLMVPFLLYRQEWGWFHPMVFLPLWTFVTSALPSVGVYISGLERHAALPAVPTEELNDLVVQALLLQAFGWLVFYAAFTGGQVRTLHLSVPEPRGRALPAKALLIAGAAIVSFLILMDAAGGLEELLLQRGVRAEDRVAADIGGHWSLIVRHLLPTTCLVWLSLQPRLVRSPLFWLLFSGGLGMSFAATGSRSSVVVPMIVALGIWALRTQSVPYVRALALTGTALLIVGIGGEFRAQTMRADTLEAVSINPAVGQAFLDGVKERLAAGGETSSLIAILGKVPEEVELLYGRSYLSIPAAPIPSRIWPDKPEAGGRLTGHLIFGYPEGGAGIPPGTAGEAFWNFHVLGVLLVFFLWGKMAKWLSHFYRIHAADAGMTALYVLTIVTFSPHSSSIYAWFHTMTSALVAFFVFCGLPRVHGFRKPGRAGVSLQ